jgi:phosphoserine phosphatase
MPTEIAHEKHLVVLDMDSTFIKDEVIDLLADRAGVGVQVAAITERSMRGELDFRESLRDRVALLTGLDSGCIADVRSAIRLSDGARELVSSLHAVGSHIAIVSGGFLNVISPLLDELAIDFYLANTLEVIEGRLTGKTTGAIIDKEAKANFLIQTAEKLGLPLDKTVAVGDGANDLAMMAVAGLSVAFNAKPVVQTAAKRVIEDGNLLHILEFLNLPQIS